jgi:putative phosphoribosyl transferase
MARVRAASEPPPVGGRTVVLADDGTASRWGARAAIMSLREGGAARIIVAVPVASSDVRDLLAREADAVVCGHVPERFLGVAAHFDDFAEPDEATVRRLLGAASARVARYVPPRVPAVATRTAPRTAPHAAPVAVTPADL